MKRVRILAVLLCVFGMAFPLMSLPAPLDAECPEGYCAGDSDCEVGPCFKRPGQSCGVCTA